MRTLEDRLRPPFLARGRGRDLLAAGLLLALVAVLLPVLRIDWPALWGASSPPPATGLSGPPNIDPLYPLNDAMTSVHLLVALGWVLCLRCGALDLSVWAVSGMSGLAAAGLIRAGWSPGAAMAAGVAAGAAVGAIHGGLVAGLRLPSLAVTALTGLAMVWSCQAACRQRQIVLPEFTFAGWEIVYSVQAPGAGGRAGTLEPLPQPMGFTRIVLVTAVYSAVLLVILGWAYVRRRHPVPGSRTALFAALTASGALSAAAGVLWLLEHNAAPAPTRLVDGLLAPTAAVLAGGAFLAGGRRALLVGVMLPLALLVCGLWQQEVLNFQRGGYPLQLVLLGCMVLAAQQAGKDFTAGRWARQRMALAAALAASAGIVIFAGSVLADSFSARRGAQLGGLLVWLAGAAAIVAYRAGAGQARPAGG